MNSNQPVIYEEGQLNNPFNDCKQYVEEDYGYYHGIEHGEYGQTGKVGVGKSNVLSRGVPLQLVIVRYI